METTTDTKTVETVITHESSHHKLIEEIAERVEERLVAKAAKWLIINFLVIAGAVGVGWKAYYQLDSAIANNTKNDELVFTRISDLIQDAGIDRLKCDNKLDNINGKIDEINRFLRDHNTLTLNGLRGR